jgi:hypothetical protein
LVSLPSSSSQLVLFRAFSANYASLNLITYLVFVVPTPATWTSFVGSAFNSAVLIWLLAASVGKNLVNLLLLLSFSKSISSVGRAVLILTQFSSFQGRGAVITVFWELLPAVTSAHVLRVGLMVWALICSRSA